jgi:hypothetical protein
MSLYYDLPVFKDVYKLILKIFEYRSNCILLEELFEAYVPCRKLKRNTANALAFEVDYEQNLIDLCEEINNGTYRPGKSIA